jgi:hypothetical protein
LADRVDVVDTDNPLVLCEFDFPAKVVQMLDQGAEDYSGSRWGLRAHKVDDMLCEVGIVFAVVVGLGTVGAVGTICSHDDVAFLWRADGDGGCLTSGLKDGV